MLFRTASQLQTSTGIHAFPPNPAQVHTPPRTIRPSVQAPLRLHRETLARGPYALNKTLSYYNAPAYMETAPMDSLRHYSLSLTEMYLKYGLGQDLSMPASASLSLLPDGTWDIVAPPSSAIPAVEASLHPFTERLARGYYLPPSHRETTLAPRDLVQKDLLSLTEYQKYGMVKVPLTSYSPMLDLPYRYRDPYYPYETLPNLSMGKVNEAVTYGTSRPLYANTSDYQTGLSQRRVTETGYDLLTVPPVSQPVASHLTHFYALPWGAEAQQGEQVMEPERLHSTPAANALPNYNQRYHLDGMAGIESLPSSSRYSIAGPSCAYK